MGGEGGENKSWRQRGEEEGFTGSGPGETTRFLTSIPNNNDC